MASLQNGKTMTTTFYGKVRDVQQKAKDFEDSINTIWTEKQKVEIAKMQGKNKWSFRLITHSLFPTAVTFFKYDGITEKETKFLVEQKTRGNTGNTTSVDNNILENKEMNKLKQFIEQSVKEYFQNIYMPKYDVEPYITQSWCNYTKEVPVPS